MTHTCLRVHVKARDGFDLPVRLVYNKEYFGESAPAIIFTSGSGTTLASFAFKPWLATALDRGCTLVYPELRGTLTQDRNWLERGTLQNKLVHFMDLGDVGHFLRDQKLAKKVGAWGTQPSGAVSVASTMLYDPELFDAVVLIVTRSSPCRRTGSTTWPSTC